MVSLNNLRLAALLAACFLLGSACLADEIFGTGYNARQISLGGAYVGMASDGAAIYANPAGLTAFDAPVLTSMFTQPTGNTSFALLAGTIPNKFDATIGLGYRNLTTSNVELTSTEVVSYSSQDLAIPYAKKLTDFVSLGGTLHFISRSLSHDVASFEGLNGSGYSLDVGLKYYYSPSLSFGLALQNLSGQINYKDGVSESLLLNTTVGSSFRLGGAGSYFAGLKQPLFFNLDASRSGGDPLLLHLGLEWWPLEPFALRVGLEQTPKSATETFNNISAGVGLKYRGVTFDFATYQQGDGTNNSSTYFSIGFVGPEKIPFIQKTSPEVFYPSPSPAPVSARKAKRVVFSDLPPGHWAKDPAELLATAGLLSVPSDGLFLPDNKLTRMQFSLLYLTAKNTSSSNPVKDVGGAAWAENPDKYATRADAASIFGLPANIVRPNDGLTRAEFAVFLSKSAFGQSAIKRLPPLE